MCKHGVGGGGLENWRTMPNTELIYSIYDAVCNKGNFSPSSGYKKNIFSSLCLSVSTNVSIKIILIKTRVTFKAFTHQGRDE